MRRLDQIEGKIGSTREEHQHLAKAMIDCPECKKILDNRYLDEDELDDEDEEDEEFL